MIHVKAYAFTLIVFLGLDSVWLGIVAQDFYASQLGSLLRDDINYTAAGAFYLAYVAGVVYFAVAPALAKESWPRAALNGGLFGLLAYGTYDMTNLATLKDWPLVMSVVDMGWGGLLTSTAAVIGYLTARTSS